MRSTCWWSSSGRAACSGRSDGYRLCPAPPPRPDRGSVPGCHRRAGAAVRERRLRSEHHGADADVRGVVAELEYPRRLLRTNLARPRAVFRARRLYHSHSLHQIRRAAVVRHARRRPDIGCDRDGIGLSLFPPARACVAWLVTWWLEDSKWGYWWRAVKDNPDAAESLGVVVFNSKMGAAAVSAFLTAVGGSFYAQFVSYIDPESVMGFQFSLLMALPAVLGGIGTLWGPVLGAVILIPLTELTRSFIGGSGRGVDLIVYGTLIVLISLARPEGLVGLFSRRRKAVAR